FLCGQLSQARSALDGLLSGVEVEAVDIHYNFWLIVATVADGCSVIVTAEKAPIQPGKVDCTYSHREENDIGAPIQRPVPVQTIPGGRLYGQVDLTVYYLHRNMALKVGSVIRLPVGVQHAHTDS